MPRSRVTTVSARSSSTRRAGRFLLRVEVASLLDAYRKSGGFAETPVFQASPELLADPVEPLEGKTIGPYLIREEIGRGDMGVVFVAEDTRSSRRVALKALTLNAGTDVDRLREEAQAAAALTHPGIATVYGFENIGGRLFVAHEYVVGQTLRALLESGPLAMRQVLDIATQLARALAAAHVQGVVHRDLKPENAVRTPAGAVKILDFGIARIESAAGDRVTRDAALLGTPGYMAPEQIRGDAVDFRADIFAFGVLVYEMVSGFNPFAAPTATAVLARTLEVQPASLGDAGGSTLDAIVAICLRKQPADRYQSTQALLADLERLQARKVNRDIAESARVSTGPAVSTARESQWWWTAHQSAMSVLYVLMVVAARDVRSWLPRPWGLMFLFVLLACAAAATSLRLHLRFSARVYPEAVGARRARALPWIRGCDAGFAGLLLLVALAIAGAHAQIATVLVAVSIATFVASFMVGPMTAKPGFRASAAPRS